MAGCFRQLCESRLSTDPSERRGRAVRRRRASEAFRQFWSLFLLSRRTPQNVHDSDFSCRIECIVAGGPGDCEEAVVVAPASEESEAMLSVTSLPKEASGQAEVHLEGNQGMLDPAEATCAVRETKSSHDCENPDKGRRRRWVLKWKCQRSVDKGNFKKLYTKGKLLGKGGYASVYEGIRKSDGLPVAIKFVSKTKVKLMKCPLWKEHLPLEVAMMKLVNATPASPHVLSLIEWFDMTLKYALVLERPQACQSLTHFCKVQGGKLMEEQARPVMQQVIKALRHCQDRGVVHRDLKPPNLLIQPDTLQVKLIDFGSAILLKDAEGQKIVGTEFYMPPEVFVHHQYLPSPATVWSVGVTLYKLVVGSLPFISRYDIMSCKVCLQPGMSNECQDLITSCLQLKPANRPTLDQIQLHPWFQWDEQSQNLCQPKLKI